LTVRAKPAFWPLVKESEPWSNQPLACASVALIRLAVEPADQAELVTLARVQVRVPGIRLAGQLTATFADDNTHSSSGDLTATINWGDGNTSQGTVSGSGGSYTVSDTHLYDEEGDFTVSVDVADTGGSTTSVSGTATVEDALLSAQGTGTPLKAWVGQSTGMVELATFIDQNPSGSASDFTATIDWGDGSTSDGTVTQGQGEYQVTGEHTYSTAGTQDVLVKIVDDGGSEATAQDTVDVLGLDVTAQVRSNDPQQGFLLPIGEFQAALNTGGVRLSQRFTTRIPCRLGRSSSWRCRCRRAVPYPARSGWI